MEATPGQNIAPSISHETRVIAEFSTDLPGLADYLSAVAWRWGRRRDEACLAPRSGGYPGD
jgi:hypothetical protein